MSNLAVQCFVAAESGLDTLDTVIKTTRYMN